MLKPWLKGKSVPSKKFIFLRVYHIRIRGVRIMNLLNSVVNRDFTTNSIPQDINTALDILYRFKSKIQF